MLRIRAALLIRFCGYASVLVAAAIGELSAQTLTGLVSSAESSEPVSGAVISALTPNGSLLGSTVTNERGSFRLKTTEPAAMLRVMRIGYRPRVVQVPVGGEVVDINVTLVRLATLLDVIEVRASAKCVPRKDRDTALALFEQIRFGLVATVVARSAVPAQVTLLRFQRFMIGNTARIRSQDVSVDSVAATSEVFRAARSAHDFVSRGFAKDSAGELLFYAPDIETLVNDEFRRGYCVQLAASDRSRPGQVGLAFSAATRDSTRVDIVGEVWVDTSARAIRTIEYRYDGLKKTLSPFRPGGRLEFRTMPNGTTMLDRWSMRLVALRVDTIPRALLRPLLRTSYEVHETGAEIATVRWSNGTSWRSALGRLRLDVTVSKGERVDPSVFRLANSSYTPSREPAGLIEFSDLLPGPYRVMVTDSTLASIDVVLDAHIPFEAVRDSVHTARLFLPSALDYARETCPAERQDRTLTRYDPYHDVNEAVRRQPDRSVALFLYVVSETGQPLANVKVSEAIVPQDREPEWHVKSMSGTTDRDGRYYSCWNYFLNERIQLWLKVDGQSPQLAVVRPTQRVHAIKFVLARDR